MSKHKKSMPPVFALLIAIKYQRDLSRLFARRKRLRRMKVWGSGNE